MNCGIYQLENLINGNIYIGQSSDIVGRRKEHRYKLKNGLHENPHLQNAFKKYGKGSFEFSVLLYCDPFNLSLYEQTCIDNLKPEYNILTECVGTSLGYKHTEDARKKMSERWHDTHTVQRARGYKLSEETKKKMSIAQKGRKVSEETRRKMSEAQKKRFRTPVSEETRRKMSKAKKGKVPYEMTEETKKKMGEGQRARYKENPVSDETREKMSKAKRGKQAYTATEETRKKMSESQKLRQQRLREQT